MSVSSISSSPPSLPPPPAPKGPPASAPAPTAAPAIAAAPAAVGKVQRAADGDFKVANPQSSQVKDKDGDYKAAGAVSAPAQSSGAVQNALSNLKVGG